MLCGIYVSLVLLSIILIIFGLNTYKRADDTKKRKTCGNQLNLLKSSVTQMKNKYQILIIPITFWLGVEQAFIGADFTKVK